MSPETLLVMGICCTMLVIGFMLGEINAMRRADRQREELRRIRQGGE